MVSHVFIALPSVGRSVLCVLPAARLLLAAFVVVVVRHCDDDAAEGAPGADLGHARRQQLVHLQDPLDPLHRRAPHHAGFPSGGGRTKGMTKLLAF